MKKWLIVSLMLYTSIQADVVVTLHGFLRGEANFKKLGKYFKEQKDDVYHFIYPSREATIKDNGLALIAFVEKIRLKHPDASIHFVTHSLGGIVLRSSLNEDSCPSYMKHGCVVLIAPPNQGSIFARKLAKTPGVKKIFGKAAGKELHTNRNFNYLGPFPETTKVLVIAGNFGWNPLIPGRNDGKVATKETLLLSPHEYIEVSAGHSWICNKKETIVKAFSFIHQLS